MTYDEATMVETKEMVGWKLEGVRPNCRSGWGDRTYVMGGGGVVVEV